MRRYFYFLIAMSVAWPALGSLQTLTSASDVEDESSDDYGLASLFDESSDNEHIPPRSPKFLHESHAGQVNVYEPSPPQLVLPESTTPSVPSTTLPPNLLEEIQNFPGYGAAIQEAVKTDSKPEDEADAEQSDDEESAG